MSGERTRKSPTPTSRIWVARSPIRQNEVEPRRLLRPLDVERRERRDDPDPGDDVARALGERLPEDTEVVRHEEGRDRDRDDVVEHLPPARDEAHELVEGVSREAGGSSGLREHHRPFDVGGGGADEDQPRDHERERGQPERERGDDAERVIDRGADVAVGGAEQGAGAVDALQGLVSMDALGHGGGLYA